MEAFFVFDLGKPTKYQSNDTGRFLAGQYDWDYEAFGSALGVDLLIKGLLEDLSVKEQQCIHCLVLCREHHMEIHGKMVKKGLDFLFSVTEVVPATHPVKEHITFDPYTVASLCTYRIVATPHRQAHIIEQIGGHRPLPCRRSPSMIQGISDIVNRQFCLSS